jgi:hypothetical protein
MNESKLDPRKLLGFKIIADGESSSRLTSPKIGDKGAPGITQDLVRVIDPNAGHKLN